MSEQAKQIIKKAIKKIFNYEFEELTTTADYLELLKISKQAENLLTVDSLILKAIESLFIENEKFIEKIENDNAIKYLDYIIDKKSYNKETKEEFLEFIKGQKEYEDEFRDLKTTEKEKLIFEYICEIKKDINTIIDCINIIYLDKCPNYIPSPKNFSFTGNFQGYFSQLRLTLNYHDFENEKEYISLEYNTENGFYFEQYSFEEAMKIRETIDSKKPRKDVKNFIKTHSKKKKKNDDNLNPNPQINNDEISLIQNTISQMNIIEYNKDEIINKNDSHEIKIIKKENENKYQDEINRLNEKFEEFQNNYLKLEKSHSELEKSHSELEKSHSELEKSHSELQKAHLELQKEHSESVKAHKEEMEKIEAELKLQKKIYTNNKKKMELKHKYDVNHLNNQIKEKEQNCKSQISKEKEKYNKLKEKFDESNISNNNLTNAIHNKDNRITELTNENVGLNRKLNTISSRVLAKSIIDFLYYAFTSFFKGKTYFEEKNIIIEKINKLKDNEYKSQKIILSEFVNYLNKIYNLKLEGDDYAHPLVGIDTLIELIGYGFENVNKILKELDLKKLFDKYNVLYKKQSREEDLGKITDEIMELLPELRDDFLRKLKNVK